MGHKKYLPTYPDVSGCVQIYHELDRLTFAGQIREGLALAVREFHLGYDRHTHQALNLFYGEKGKVTRFAENDHIAPVPAHQGSVAQHELMCIPVLGLIAELAAMQLGPEAETRHAVQIHNMRKAQNAQISVHDGGELLVEFSSLSQRVKAGEPGEKDAKARLEREICEFGLRLAFKMVETYRSEARQEQEYAKVIASVRQELLAPQGGQETFTMSELEARAHNVLEQQAQQRDIHHLSPQSNHALAHLLHSYDGIEFPQRFAQFNGKLAKNVENIQSCLHYVEHSGLSGAASRTTAASKTIMNDLWYAERELPAVFNALRAGDPVERAFALAAAGLAYETNLAQITTGIPAYLDREAVLRRNLPAQPTEEQLLRVESAATAPLARAHEIIQTKARFDRNNDSPLDFDKPEVSAQQLAWLYGTALSWVRGPEAASYPPPTQALVYTRRLSAELEARMLTIYSQSANRPKPDLVLALIGKRLPRPAA